MTDATKPPLSDPMAEALAEDAAAAAAKATAAPQEAPIATAEPAVEAPVGDTAAPDPAATEDAPKPKRTAEQVMQGRISRLTAEKAEADRRAADAVRQNEAMKRLLDAQGKTPDTPAATENTSERRYTQAELQVEADRIAQAQAFNARANETYEAGREKYGDWEGRMEGLRITGLMSETLIDAAMASDAPSAVLHHLGGDLAEAERIAALPPIRMGVELGKLAMKLSTPKPGARISGAPTPITPVTPVASPVVDLSRLADGDNMAAWVEARKKAGDPYATGRRR